MEWKYSLSTPSIGDEEIEAVTRVLRSRWLTMGSAVHEFEKAFAAKVGVRHALAVASCTAALHMANVALGVTSGDEVICPNLTFVASANASRYCGARVLLADVISTEDLTVDPRDIERLISPRTRAITVMHYAGFSCNMATIQRIATSHGLPIIEDCAHAPHASCRMEDGSLASLGSIGKVGCFSFYGNKNMTTGEGGMVTTNDEDLAERLRLLRSHGMTTASYDRFKGHASTYDVVLLGYNYRMDDVHAAIGIEQLKKLDSLQARRRLVFRWYWDALNGNPHVTLPFRDRDLETSSCHIFPIVAKDRYEQIKASLHAARVQTSKHYQPISGFSIYGSSTAGDKVHGLDQIITLPLSPEMVKEDVLYISKAINDA